jgi:hypothetical protein
MNYYFHCQCGQKLRVTRSQSGSQAPCPCGQSPTVPSLSKLSREEPTRTEQRTTPPEFQVQSPASWLMGLSLAWIGCLALLLLMSIVQLSALDGGQSRPGDPAPAGAGVVMVRVALALVMIGVNAVVFLGAQALSKLRNHSLARAAVTLALMPGLSPFLILGIPIAIAANSSLGRPEVKQAFRG